MTLIELAEWRDWKDLKQGELFVSMRELQADLGMGMTRLLNQLKKLVELGGIQVTPTKYGTKIRVIELLAEQVELRSQMRTQKAVHDPKPEGSRSQTGAFYRGTKTSKNPSYGAGQNSGFSGQAYQPERPPDEYQPPPKLVETPVDERAAIRNRIRKMAEEEGILRKLGLNCFQSPAAHWV